MQFWESRLCGFQGSGFSYPDNRIPRQGVRVTREHSGVLGENPSAFTETEKSAALNSSTRPFLPKLKLGRQSKRVAA
jgi:hypothetical protein